MTPLDRRSRAAFLVASLLLTAGLAGCIGSDGDDAGFRLFVAAVGDGPASASIEAFEPDVATEGQAEALDVDASPVDLGELAANGQAVQVGSVTGINATADGATLRIAWLDVGEHNLTDVSVDLPVSFPVQPGVDATLTIDLDTTREEERLTFQSLVLERGDTRLDEFTRSDLHPEDREEIEPLPTPSIVATADGGNLTGPSFPVNQDINFTYTLPPGENASVRNVFWAFGDDSTAKGAAAQHAYRAPGFYRVTLILEGEQGQQATVSAALDAYFIKEGEGNVGAGTNGTGAVQDRDVKDHTVEIPKNFTNISLRLEQTASGGFCSENTTVENDTAGVNESAPTGGHCAPSNVHVELYNANDELLGKNTSEEDVKWINVTGLMAGGPWTVRVKGDQGAAVGYSYHVQAHYFGLCPEAGGLVGFDCPPAPEPMQQDNGTGLP